MPANQLKALREHSRITLEVLAERVGLSPSYVQRLESGNRNLSTKHLAAFARELGVQPQDIVASTLVLPPVVESKAPASRIIRPAGPEASEVQKVGEGWPDTGDEWMDVHGVTQGGDDGYFYFGDVIDQVRRPPGLRNAKNVAALNVAGTSMVPRFKPGALIYVQQRMAVAGDDVVVELYPENDGDQPKSFLKELVKQTGLRLYCKQFNPAADIEFDMGEVKTVWRVLTLQELLG